MARLLFLAALVILAIGAEAHTPPPAKAPVAAPPAHSPKKIDTFSVKCVMHNVADRPVTFGLEIAGTKTKQVVAKSGCWTATKPVAVSCKAPVVSLCATVKTDKGINVSKSFPINLLDQFKFLVPKCLKTLRVAACKSKSQRGVKCIDISIEHKKIISFTL